MRISLLLFFGEFYLCVLASKTASTVKKFAQTADADVAAGAQVMRVTIQDAADKKKLDGIRNQISFEVIHRGKSDADFIVTSSKLDQTRKLLESSNLKYKVLISDVQKKIEAQNPSSLRNETNLRSSKGHHGFNFERYHSLKDIHDHMDFLSTKYKSFVTTKVIGTSLSGKPLKVLRVKSAKPNAPCFWIDGGIHAREWVAPATVMYITSQLVEHRDKLPQKMKDLTFYILAVVNPDGYEYSRKSASTRLWRKNREPEKDKCFGVDINRNFPFKWGGLGTSDDACDDVYKGPAASSEAETKVVIGYLSKKANRFKGFVAFHSYGQEILIPYSYDNIKCPDYGDLKKVADKAAKNIKAVTGAVYEVMNGAALYPAAGVSDDWAKSIGIKYVFAVELRDTGDNGFLLPPSEIIPAGKEGFEVVKAIAEAI